MTTKDEDEIEPRMSEMWRAIARRLHSAALAGDWGEIARIRLTCDETGYVLEREEAAAEMVVEDVCSCQIIRGRIGHPEDNRRRRVRDDRCPIHGR